MANEKREEEARAPVRKAREWAPLGAVRNLLAWDSVQEVVPRLHRLWRGAEDKQGYAPAFEVRESNDIYLFKADLPGVRESDVDIQVRGNRLTVSGRREPELVEESAAFFCSERSFGSFTRTFTLPEGISSELVRAHLGDGVLTVQVPKATETHPRRIAVSAASGGGGGLKA